MLVNGLTVDIDDFDLYGEYCRLGSTFLRWACMLHCQEVPC